MTQGLRTFLTFQGGVAKAALDLYREAFADFELTAIALYGAGEPGPEGTDIGRDVPARGSGFQLHDDTSRT